MSKVLDLTGNTYNKLTVIKRGVNTKQNQARWRCKCECGNITEVISAKLRSGHTKSCGCWNREVTIQRNKDSATHGLSKHSLFNTFTGMIDRCANVKGYAYKDYGGRGIRVCEEWINNPKAFFDYMGDKPSSSHSIDRVDNDSGYKPGNVRWATSSVQCNNKRNNRVITTKWGETKTLSQWSTWLGISVHTLYDRLGKLNWTVEQALEFEARPKRNRAKIQVPCPDGTCKSVYEISKLTGIGYRTILKRFNSGWSSERILSPIVKGKSDPRKTKPT